MRHPGQIGRIAERVGSRATAVAAATLLGVGVVALLGVGVMVSVGGAGARSAPAAPEPACDGETAAVLADASAEPDLYAAFLLAGVLGTDCLVDAGDRDGPLPATSATLLDTGTLTHGYAVGGTAAVPAAKLVGGLSWRRADGADRWATLRIIGAAAADPTSLPAAEGGAAASPASSGRPAAECGGETAAVLADASAEPDLYAAFLLAGVLGTDCLVDAGDRDGPLPATSATLLDTGTLTHGYAVGGTAAVPAAKLVGGLSWRRADGADRWATLRIIGAAAADPTSLPAAEPAPSGKFTALSITTAELFHGCALRSSGHIACWGDNSQGQAQPPAGEFTAVSTGEWRACGLRPSGQVACWGWPYQTQAEPPAGEFAAIAAGRSHDCALRTSGEAFCWGYDDDGQVTGTPRSNFAAIAVGRGFETPNSFGHGFTCGLRPWGRVVCWGDYDDGQVLKTPTGEFTAIAAGSDHACALRTSGHIACWGNDHVGQVSDAPAGAYTAIAAGRGHSCALRPWGTVFCWGFDSHGQVSDTPTGEFTAIAAGGYVTCGLRPTGQIECWGQHDTTVW